MDYRNTKISQNALKVSESSVFKLGTVRRRRRRLEEGKEEEEIEDLKKKDSCRRRRLEDLSKRKT